MNHRPPSQHFENPSAPSPFRPSQHFENPSHIRDLFPSIIPAAFGVESHYWDSARVGKRGVDVTWSLEKYP